MLGDRLALFVNCVCILYTRDHRWQSVAVILATYLASTKDFPAARLTIAIRGY